MRHSAAAPSDRTSAKAQGSTRNRVAATLTALAVAGGMTAALLGAFGGATSSAAAAPLTHSASAVHGDGTQMG